MLLNRIKLDSYLKLKSFKAWAKNKNEDIAILSFIRASVIEETYIFLNELRKGLEYDSDFELPKLKEWLGFYKNHRQLEKSYKGVLKKMSGYFSDLILLDEEVDDILSEAQKIEKSAPKGQPRKISPELKKRAEYFLEEGFDKIAKGYIEFFQERINGKAVITVPDDAIDQPEIIFCMLVSYPCWLLYQDLPAFLMRKARNGDEDSLIKLLRLDPSALFDEKISEQVHKSRTQRNQIFYNEIIKSLQKPPRVKISLKKIKMNTAGLISVESSRLGGQLTEPEIRSLFDAIAKDKGLGDIDTDLPESPESFIKAIQRERKFWGNFYQVDKK